MSQNGISQNAVQPELRTDRNFLDDLQAEIETHRKSAAFIETEDPWADLDSPPSQQDKAEFAAILRGTANALTDLRVRIKARQ